MGVARPSRAVEIVAKWNCKIEKKATSKDYEENAPNDYHQQERGLDMLSFSDESRKSSPVRVSDTDLILDQEESIKQQWYIKNSQFLQRVVGKGFEEFTDQINGVIQN